MVINGRFRVSMQDVFPAGAFVVGEVEKVRDFDKSTPERFVHAQDKQSGELVWSVPVLDADEAAPKSAKTVVVKIVAAVQPVPPDAVVAAGHEFRPVEFEDLTVRPYVDDRRNRVGYSLRARAMRAQAGGRPTKVAGGSSDAEGKTA